MSTVESTPSDHAPDRPASAAGAFDAVVWDTHEVCSHCFARLKRDHRRVQDGTLGEDKTDKDDYGETTVVAEEHGNEWVTGTTPQGSYGAVATYESGTFCGHCGVAGGRALPETLTRREALRRVPELGERLREAGYQVDEHAIRVTVRELKSRQALANEDKAIFERAAKLGIRYGGGDA